jgi:hypothetical protein
MCPYSPLIPPDFYYLIPRTAMSPKPPRTNMQISRFER